MKVHLVFGQLTRALEPTHCSELYIYNYFSAIKAIKNLLQFCFSVSLAFSTWSFFQKAVGDTMNESLVSELILDPNNHHQTSNVSALSITGPLRGADNYSSVSTTAATAVKSADAADPEWAADTAWTVGFTFIVVVGTCGNAIVLWIVTGTFYLTSCRMGFF